MCNIANAYFIKCLKSVEEIKSILKKGRAYNIQVTFFYFFFCVLPLVMKITG